MPKAAKAKVGQNKKVIHPNSRKACQLARQVHHEERVDRRKDERYKKLEMLAEKLKHFQNCLEENKSDYTKQDLLEILDKYFHRFDKELEQIAIVNSIGSRNGQRHASREQVIRLTQAKERAEFDTVGVEVPDLLNKKNLTAIREWTGEVRFIPNLKLRRVFAKDKVESTQYSEQAQLTTTDAPTTNDGRHNT
ncbi:translation machinery-associated protein 16-like [Liolophura sinensis]|uniref:translation machinery-associated protein 16-like n=1 Tax=Liolophura sinensis TaxID=3198878 RepID=UPI003158B125